LLGCRFYGEFAASPDESQQSDLFAGLFVAEVAEPDGPFSGFRHEPSSLGYRLRILAPGTLNRVAWEKSKLTHAV
jgi:hypothetical protein